MPTSRPTAIAIAMPLPTYCHSFSGCVDMNFV